MITLSFVPPCPVFPIIFYLKLNEALFLSTEKSVILPLPSKAVSSL